MSDRRTLTAKHFGTPRGRRAGMFAALLLALICAVPASAAGVAEVTDPSGDAGAGAKGTTDLLSARWNGFDLTITVAKIGNGTTELSGHVFLDTDADNVPDWVVRFSRGSGDTTIAWELAPASNVSADCADVGQATQAAGSTTATAGSGTESFVLSIPGAKYKIPATFRWAVQGQDHTSAPTTYGLDYLPDGAQPSSQSGNVGSAGCQSGTVWLHMAGGVAYPPPSASYTVAPSAPVEGDPITLTSTSTGEIATTEWDLDGDGTYGDANGKSATVSMKAGKHDVGLLVTDPHGEHDAMRTTITVGPAPAPPPTTTTTTPTTTTTTPAPGSPQPTANVALAKGNTRGAALVLDASGSHGQDGRKIVDYRWDFNGDGRTDADTGNSPIAIFNSHGNAATTTLTVTDDHGFVGHTQFTAPAARASDVLRDHCASHQYETSILGFTVTGSCVTEENGRIHVLPIDTGAPTNRFVIYVGGAPLVTDAATNEIVIDRSGHPRHIRSTSQWRAMWLDPPSLDGAQHPMTMWQSDRTGFDFVLGPEQQLQGERVTPIAHLQADDDCRHNAGFQSTCVNVGGLPITGMLDLDWDNTTSQMIFDVQVRLQFQIAVTGGARLRFDVDTGNIRLDALRIGVGDIDIGAVEIHDLTFEFQGPTAEQPGLTWQANVDIGVLEDEVRVAGQLAFVNGRFCYASADVRLTPGIAVYAGVFLDRFRGAVLYDCGHGSGTWGFGGGLGVNIADAARIDADFNYETRNDGLSMFSLDGTLRIFGTGLANAHSEWWSDGYFGWGGGIDFSYPERSPYLHVVARMDGWLEPDNHGGTNWQMAGYGDISVGPLNAVDITGRGFINQHYAAGCGSVRVAIFSSGGCAYYDFATNESHSLGGDADSLTPYSAVPTHTAESIRPGSRAARDAAPGAVAFDVKPGQRLLNLTVEGNGATPDVTLTDPNGKTYAVTGVGIKGDGFEGWRPAGMDQEVFVLHQPAGGEWTLAPRGGSAPVKDLLGAAALPKLKITASVRGTGSRRTLVWHAAHLAGRTVRFFERGANVANDITTTRAQDGRVRFTLQPGSAGKRTIQAIVTSSGLPAAPITLGRFTAPAPPKARRVGRLRLRRRGYVVTATWRRVAGATGYLVTVRGTDGRRERHLVKRPRLVLPDVSPLTRLTIAVRAYTVSMLRPGAARAATLRAVRT